ncbi:MAG: bifunctional folylpolyglutamate synthase/dihydrofolate synthase [Actinomycetota bacterium]
MRYAQAVAALDRRTNYERSGRLTAPTLDRMKALLDLMDHPERGYPAIHLTGTNGKTTCARAATELLRAAGLRVATYTSPHVVDVRERFAYDGRPISEEDFVEAWRELAPYLQHFDDQGMPITWFEAATALAFMWFADKAVDAAVIEVGMGGSWDATNVIDASVAAIARIDVDHPELGSTPAEVAVEKAGIIKAGAIVCSLEQHPAVHDVLRARCEEVGAQLRPEGEAFSLEKVALAVGGQSLSLQVGDDRYEDMFLPLFGEQFAHDVTLGVAAARAFLGDRSLDADLVGEALGSVRVPGRMEVLRRAPLVVLDGAHNPAAAEALATAMSSSFRWERLWLVVSVMDDKDVAGVLGPLVGVADQLIVTRNDSPRAASVERLAAEARALGADPISVPNVPDAISVAIERAEEQDCILVAGSLYTVGEARRKLVSA